MPPIRVHRRCLASRYDVVLKPPVRPHPKEEAMSHALATVLHRGRKAASNIMAACLASSREGLLETGVRMEIEN